MASSCPYCGAALKLKFCVVCGRQSKLNKMGQLRSGGRNTDATTRLEDPFFPDENVPHRALRFRTSMTPILVAAIGGIIAGILIFCAGKEALNLYNGGSIELPVVPPWMQSIHVHFPRNWPQLPSLNHEKTAPNPKKIKSNKHQKNSNK